VGHARHAAYGDSLARLLAHCGHSVEREYYCNDYGRQMRMLGASVASRYGALFGREVPIPEDGYHGEYVVGIAEQIRDEVGDRFVDRLEPLDPEVEGWLARRGGELMLQQIEHTLASFRVRFDTVFSETSLHERGLVESAVEALRASGDAYESEGALWFATTTYGDEKDRVLVRGDGQTTYLAADVAYHLDKAGRGPGRLIDVLGADHHGYIARLRAVLEAGGHPGERLEVMLMQLVSLVEQGEAKKMSKRAGTLVTMDELVGDIGVDAARFFLVQRSHETPLDLDLDLAREQSQENPVYYVQYAHTRTQGILRQLDGEPSPAGPPAELDASERALVMRLADWPDALAEAEVKRAPHRIAAYLVDAARDFHGFYHRCRVAGEPDDVQAFRVDLTRATAVVLRTGLGLLGVSAPDRM
jgi:arginyl-tRNA synthetase